MSVTLDIYGKGRSHRRAPAMPESCQQAGGCCGGNESHQPSPPDFGSVCVGGVEIAPEAIAREMQHHPAPDPASAWRAAAQALVVRELLLREAGRLGIEAVREDDEVCRETEEDACIGELLDRVIHPEAPDDAECRRIYDEFADRFRTADMFEASHILVVPEAPDDAGWLAAEHLAQAIIAEVGSDGEAFAAAAREFSSCPSAHQDGSLGQVRRGDLVPQVMAVIERLGDAETSPEPVRSEHGWHIIRRARRIEGHVLPFEIVHAKIADMLEARSWTLAVTRHVYELAKAARVEGVDMSPPEGPVDFRVAAGHVRGD